MKFIHLADAHLDSPFRGLSFLPSKAFKDIYQASDKSFKRIVDLALKEQVDLVLIAGDTFDSNHPSPRSQLFFAEQIKRLNDAEIQVVMIFGNHDHMRQEDLLVTPSPFFKLLGNGEQVETVTLKAKSGFNYDVTGFSYLNNHILEDKLPEFPAKSANYAFGIMHAQEKTAEKSQNVYAPFDLQELKDLNYDYFALGHIHLRQNLSMNPLINYPGNIQGRHINELGAKGCLLGEIDENTKQTQTEFYETSPIIWQANEITFTKIVDKSELRKKLTDLGSIEQTTYFSLRLKGSQYLTDEEIELVSDSDFWQSLSADLPFNSQVVDVRFESSAELELNNSDRQAFDQAAQEIFTEDEFKKTIQDWAKKDALAVELAENKNFMDEVKNLTRFKLAKKLKGLTDETETD